MRRWSVATDWSDRHTLALLGGALVGHTLGGLAAMAHTAVDALGLVAIAALTVLGVPSSTAASWHGRATTGRARAGRRPLRHGVPDRHPPADVAADNGRPTCEDPGMEPFDAEPPGRVFLAGWGRPSPSWRT